MEGFCIQAHIPSSSKGLFKNLRASAVSFPSVHLATHLLAKLQSGTISKSEQYSLDETTPHSAALLFLFDENMYLWEISCWSSLRSLAHSVAVVVFHTLESPMSCFTGSEHTLQQGLCDSREYLMLRRGGWDNRRTGKLLCKESETFIAYRSRSQSIYTKKKAGTPSWENMWIDWGPAWGKRLAETDSCLGCIITGLGAEVLELLLEAKNSRKVDVLSKIV